MGGHAGGRVPCGDLKSSILLVGVARAGMALGAGASRAQAWLWGRCARRHGSGGESCIGDNVRSPRVLVAPWADTRLIRRTRLWVSRTVPVVPMFVFCVQMPATAPPSTVPRQRRSSSSQARSIGQSRPLTERRLGAADCSRGATCRVALRSSFFLARPLALGARVPSLRPSFFPTLFVFVHAACFCPLVRWSHPP